MSSIKQIPSSILADGLIFGEGTRWRNGKLYLSDMLGKKVVTVDDSGKIEKLVDAPNQPNGIVFLDDGTLIYNSMFDKKLYSIQNGKSELYADLSPLMTGYMGDMVVDAAGRIYVDDVGGRVLHGEPRRPGRVIMVNTDKSLKSVVEDVAFPNGIVISPDGQRMFLGETHNHCVLQFDISPDGLLHNRRKFLDTFDLMPYGVKGDGISFPWVDGMCMDAEEGLWLCAFKAEAFVRVDKNATITHMVRVKGEATSCALGGPGGKTLFGACNELPEGEDTFEAMRAGKSKCRIIVAQVDIPKGNTRP